MSNKLSLATMTALIAAVAFGLVVWVGPSPYDWLHTEEEANR